MVAREHAREKIRFGKMPLNRLERVFQSAEKPSGKEREITQSERHRREDRPIGAKDLDPQHRREIRVPASEKGNGSKAADIIKQG